MQESQDDAGSSSSPSTSTAKVFRDRGLNRRFFDAGCWAFDVMLLWLAATLTSAAWTSGLNGIYVYLFERTVEPTMPPAAWRAAEIITALGAVILAVRIVRAHVRVTATTVVVVNPLSIRRIPREDVFSVCVGSRRDRTPWPVEGRSLDLDARRPDGRRHDIRCWAVGAQQLPALSEAIGLGASVPATQLRSARRLRRSRQRHRGAHRRCHG